MKDSQINLKEYLEKNCPGYTPINKAPGFDELIDRAEAQKVHPDKIFSLEAEKEYSAIDSAKNIYLMQNPALMTYQAHRGATKIEQVRCRKYEPGALVEEAGKSIEWKGW